jgi:hypothetical protein
VVIAGETLIEAVFPPLLHI